MNINFNSMKPVYLQIAEAIEDDIISGALSEGDAAYSQLIIARELSVNPATAAKGINTLVAKGILEKQRGASMTVTVGARDRLLQERRENGISELVSGLVTQANKVGLSEDAVITAIKTYYRKLEGKRNE